jgi:hypothetical protein
MGCQFPFGFKLRLRRLSGLAPTGDLLLLTQKKQARKHGLCRCESPELGNSHERVGSNTHSALSPLATSMSLDPMQLAKLGASPMA